MSPLQLRSDIGPIVQTACGRGDASFDEPASDAGAGTPARVGWRAHLQFKISVNEVGQPPPAETSDQSLGHPTEASGPLRCKLMPEHNDAGARVDKHRVIAVKGREDARFQTWTACHFRTASEADGFVVLVTRAIARVQKA